jgi:hypothetical protein
MRSQRFLGLAALAVAAVAPAAAIAGDDERKLFVESATENTTLNTATLPVFSGSTSGGSLAYVVTESSDKKDAERRGVNYAPKLSNARGTSAVQKATWVNGKLNFMATVDFSPTRVVTPGPRGFPPLAASPGAVGEAGYTPLVQLPSGVILNAPHIMNATGTHDKLVSPVTTRATFQETEGFYNAKDVYYVSFDASQPDVSALEGVTYAPALNAAPGLGSSDKKTSSRSGIAPFVNGQTGVANPNRQGLNSALLGEGDPLNAVQSSPHNTKYSPLWDVHLTEWTAAAVASGRHLLQDDFDEIEDLADDGLVTGPGGAPWGAVGAIVNCPVISQD